MTEVFLGLALLALWLTNEIDLRGQAGLSPSKWRHLWLLMRNRHADGRPVSKAHKALLFAAVASFSFSFWEAFIRGVLDYQAALPIWIGGALLFMVIFF